jgi:hypothetical protein
MKCKRNAEWRELEQKGRLDTVLNLKQRRWYCLLFCFQLNAAFLSVSAHRTIPLFSLSLSLATCWFNGFLCFLEGKDWKTSGIAAGTLQRSQRWADRTDGCARSRETGNKRIDIPEEGHYSICVQSETHRKEAEPLGVICTHSSGELYCNTIKFLEHEPRDKL